MGNDTATTRCLPRSIGCQSRFTAYDAVYVALAGLLDATLVTLDRRLARQAGTLVSVHVPD